MSRFSRFGAALFLVCTLGLVRVIYAASGITVKAGVDKPSVFIAEPVKYTILISTDKDTEVEFPDLLKSLQNFTLKDSGFKESAFWGKKKIERWYIISSFDIGKQVIPKSTIKYRVNPAASWQEQELGEQQIQIKSALGNETSQDIKDIKPPVWVKPKFNFLLLFILVVLALAVAFWKIFWKKKNALLFPEPITPAHILAYAQLEELQNKELIRKGLIKQYFFELSLIIRRYLENRFSLRAPEMTTEEFLGFVRDSVKLQKEHKELLKNFLNCCDLVKFAKYAPSMEEIDSAFSAAKQFVDQTKEENVPA